VAGKTGTAQNPHGADHGWFIGFAPADKPEIIVGSIMEKALHGSSVAPWVVRIIRRYLEGQGRRTDMPIQIFVPEDSAPRAEDVPAVDSVARNRP
jgi:penicillin-binding protein 2